MAFVLSLILFTSVIGIYVCAFVNLKTGLAVILGMIVLGGFAIAILTVRDKIISEEEIYENDLELRRYNNSLKLYNLLATAEILEYRIMSDEVVIKIEDEDGIVEEEYVSAEIVESTRIDEPLLVFEDGDFTFYKPYAK